MILSKSFHPEDYNQLMVYVDSYKRLLARGVPAQVNHKHRAWEYAMALTYLGLRNSHKILDIGGGGSLFAPLAAKLGYDVTVIDGSRQARQIHAQNIQLGTDVKLINTHFNPNSIKLIKNLTGEQFDAIVAISVIEHVPDDQQFLYNMMDLGAPTIFLTTDFSEHGTPVSTDHLRTYTPHGLLNLATQDINWELYKNEEYWIHRGQFVYTYNFASVALCTN